ncbi:cobyric acid synthase [Ruminococcus flavefaciens]|uniref:Cobyric acid synthase n=1 Tax=Ruminococcus flavefaciens TaxID=1265 RepID=A0A1M7LWA0_RUMFL|nr:cobyric acid synthase [Ruminococcus flavefaciens]SHM82082.1 adenosylcobyric acid synthase (glutamine-hydrolysing) [Ruminococcus flavefaciens]
MAKAIMIQGTMSNAGKSFFAAALCRIFSQDGYSCAPFKSQNMALNSYITADGFEIGRAQAMQAEAAGIEPSVLINPVLLKPTTDVGSQVIVNGKAVGNMTAAEYFKRKKELIPQIMESYNKLSAMHDIIVIEGAGSPVELNLKSDDIVNMGMAQLAKAPVLLVGDIDRGGVFAQLLGTLSLLEKHELDMVKGLVVNKFRGDISLFDSGKQILEERGGKPLLGVVPYLRCDIEDEDSLSRKLDSRGSKGIIDIAVIRLPRISNFTDFDVFAQYDGVSVRYVTKYDDLEEPDMIIIPGTKSTIADMKWLRESGMELAVKRCVARGVPVFGICGGFQMLGESISDPLGSEGGGSISGMGLLKCRTVFGAEKVQTQTKGNFCKIGGFFECLSEAEFSGYEIHMGTTESESPELLECGGAYEGNVYGCYIHGIFDSQYVSERLVKRLFEHKDITYRGGIVNRENYKQAQFDMLADGVRRSIDMELLYRIIGEGI